MANIASRASFYVNLSLVKSTVPRITSLLSSLPSSCYMQLWTPETVEVVWSTILNIAIIFKGFNIIITQLL